LTVRFWPISAVQVSEVAVLGRNLIWSLEHARMTWSHAEFLLQLFSPYQLRKNNVASEIKNISVARVELSPEINRYAEMENSTTAEALRIKDMDNYPLTIMATARHPLLAEPGRSVEHIRSPS
jgi:hypothetical protein